MVLFSRMKNNLPLPFSAYSILTNSKQKKKNRIFEYNLNSRKKKSNRSNRDLQNNGLLMLDVIFFLLCSYKYVLNSPLDFVCVIDTQEVHFAVGFKMCKPTPMFDGKNVLIQSTRSVFFEINK